MSKIEDAARDHHRAIDQVQGDVASAARADAAGVECLDAGRADPGADPALLYSRSNLSDVLPPAANITVSNVPGPRQRFMPPARSSCTSSRCRSSTHGLALNVTVQSYRDQLDFGFIAGANIIPHVRLLCEYAAGGIRRAGGGVRAARSRRPKARPSRECE